MGTYSYPAAGQARPHAVSAITGTVNGIVNPTYTYDANGNMTAGAGRTVQYRSFNMAAEIAQGSFYNDLVYNSGHNRVVQVTPSGSTFYATDPISGARSEQYNTGSTSTWRDYIMVDGKIVAERKC